MTGPLRPGGTPMDGSRVRLLAAFGAVYVIWGSTYLFIRFAVETLPPFSMAGVRFTVAGAMLYAWARARGIPSPSRDMLRGAAIAGLFLLLGGNGAVVWAEQRVPSGLTALLVATVPVWMVMLDWIRPGGRRPRAVVFVGLALGLAGLALLVGRPSVDGSGVDLAGAIVLVVGSILWAIGSLYVGRNPRPPSALLANALQMLAGGVALLAVGVSVGELSDLDPGAASTRSLLSLVYLIIAGSLIGFTAYTYLLQHTTPAKASTYAYVNPVVAVLLGWAFAGEEITFRTMIAAAIILAGVAIITVTRRGASPDQRATPSDVTAEPSRDDEPQSRARRKAG